MLRLSWALLLAGCAAASPPPSDAAAGARSPAAEQEVVAAAEALFSAMRTRDTAAIRDLLLPEMQIVSVRVGGAPAAAPQRRSAEQFIASIARPGEELRERMWSPRVELDGDLATLWAPYDFHVGERFSHCGHDAFHLVREGGRWRISALAYTIQTTGCEAGK